MEDRNAPATKGDIADLDQKIDQKIEMLRSDLDQKIDQLRSEVNHGYRDLSERLDEGITKLLTAFYSVAETHGRRLAEHDSNEAAIRSRLALVEDRLMAVEKQLLRMPPAA